ncbi:MAG: hypothetical protein M3Q29_12980 [Chloroflexota bacterium]|nr:hypothetical protein [Chloroflexota bacterium]
MQPEDARQMVDSAVRVDRMKIGMAKDYILTNFQESIPSLIEAFVRQQGFADAPRVVINPSLELARPVHDAAEYIAWRLALCEAVWGLIHAGLLVPKTSGLWEPPMNVGWTTVVGNSGGMSSSWQFHSCHVPNYVTLSPSAKYGGVDPLADSDLYLRDIGVPDMHPEVDESLRSAVQCFRGELYLPALVMLARAVEGAWLELGRALVDATPSHAGKEGVEFAKAMSEQEISLARLIAAVRAYYERRDLWKDAWTRSGVPGVQINGAAIWSDHVRVRRNVIHYDNMERYPYTYETVATLLLAATQHLRVIYGARRALLLLASSP